VPRTDRLIIAPVRRAAGDRTRSGAARGQCSAERRKPSGGTAQERSPEPPAVRPPGAAACQGVAAAASGRGVGTRRAAGGWLQDWWLRTAEARARVATAAGARTPQRICMVAAMVTVFGARVRKGWLSYERRCRR
jgi:hypothetical protein